MGDWSLVARDDGEILPAQRASKGALARFL
jgi:hypothetical protein